MVIELRILPIFFDERASGLPGMRFANCHGCEVAQLHGSLRSALLPLNNFSAVAIRIPGFRSD